MASEEILGEQLERGTDLYGLGVIMYEMLSGRVPFDAHSPYELWQKVLETEALPLSALNPKSDLQLTRIAHKLIRKEADDRFQTAEEVYEAQANSTQPTHLPPPPPPFHIHPRHNRPSPSS